MSAPLLLAAMVMERRAQRPAVRRYRLARFAAALLAGGLVLAMSSPSDAAATAPSKTTTLSWVA